MCLLTQLLPPRPLTQCVHLVNRVEALTLQEEPVCFAGEYLRSAMAPHPAGNAFRYQVRDQLALAALSSPPEASEVVSRNPLDYALTADMQRENPRQRPFVSFQVQ